MLRRAASLMPITLRTTRKTIVTMPPMRVVGLRLEGRPEDGQVVGHEEGRDGDGDDVVEHQRPAGAEADELVEGPAREARRAARLGHHRRRLGVRPRGGAEEQPGEQEDERRDAERPEGDDAQRVVDRRADVAVGGAEQRRHAEDLVQALPLSVLASRHPSPRPGEPSWTSPHDPQSDRQRSTPKTISATPAMSCSETGQSPPQTPFDHERHAEHHEGPGEDLFRPAHDRRRPAPRAPAWKPNVAPGRETAQAAQDRRGSRPGRLGRALGGRSPEAWARGVKTPSRAAAAVSRTP